MKKTLITALSLFFFLSGCGTNKTQEQAYNTTTMKITSSAYAENGRIPSKYTCDGQNINPPVEFSAIPEGTKSLALIYEDPDAPSGTWIHWILWNIDPADTIIPENSVPRGAVLGKTDFGQNKYDGPCPPSGTHRYVFKAYALDSLITLAPGSLKIDLETAMKDHILAEASLTGKYSKK